MWQAGRTAVALPSGHAADNAPLRLTAAIAAHAVPGVLLPRRHGPQALLHALRHGLLCAAPRLPLAQRRCERGAERLPGGGRRGLATRRAGAAVHGSLGLLRVGPTGTCCCCR